MIHRSFVTFAVAVIMPFLFDGCLIATQSFNHGKLLNPGERMLSTGFGWKNATHYFKRYEDAFDTVSLRDTSIYIPDSTRCNWFNIILDYRAGVLRKYPFGRGLEIGYHIETALRGYYSPETGKRLQIEAFSPPLLAIETRFGFPDVTLERSIFHHNMSIGWLTGEYVDNGWFIGYAAGWEFAKITPFINTTLTETATDIVNKPVLDDSTFFRDHDRTLVCRISAGASWQLPFNYSLLPEYITPECSLIFPHYANFQSAGFTAAVGIRWLLGQ